jgi:hypothetical protein
MFSGIYFTVVRRNPLLAGAMFGAAFMCRPSTILGGLFAIVAFSDLWLPAAQDASRSFMKRLNLRPLVALAVGVAPFIALNSLVNYLRFGSPFESGYSYGEQIYQSHRPSLPVRPVQPAVPNAMWRSCSTDAGHLEPWPYVWPSWAGGRSERPHPRC